MATRPELLETVAPSNQSFEEGDYAGIFQFNFWRFGRWEQVIINDFLPCYEEEGRWKLLSCQNREQPNEMWTPHCGVPYAKRPTTNALEVMRYEKQGVTMRTAQVLVKESNF